MKISIDDGCASDERMATLADKYEIELIIYLPVEWHSLAYEKGYEPLDYDKAVKLSKHFEIGSHTITHRHLTAIDEEDAMKEIAGSKYMLGKMFNREIKKFCPPRGYTNDLLTNFTNMFYESQRLTKGKGLVHIHPNSGANGNRHWLDCVDENTTELWGHTWEFDKYGLWDELESFLEGIISEKR